METLYIRRVFNKSTGKCLIMSLLCKLAELNCVHCVANVPVVLWHEGVESINAGHQIQQQQQQKQQQQIFAYCIYDAPLLNPTPKHICPKSDRALSVSLSKNSKASVFLFFRIFDPPTQIFHKIKKKKKKKKKKTPFKAHLSRRLTGELIVYPCSGVRLASVRRSQFQRFSPLKRLGQSKPNFMWSILRKGEQKFI